MFTKIPKNINNLQGSLKNSQNISLFISNIFNDVTYIDFACPWGVSPHIKSGPQTNLLLKTLRCLFQVRLSKGQKNPQGSKINLSERAAINLIKILFIYTVLQLTIIPGLEKCCLFKGVKFVDVIAIVLLCCLFN